MNLNIKDLLAEATVDLSKLEKKSVNWTRLGDDGKEVTSTFDIFIVVDPSFASSDRIQFGTSREDNASRMARIISERVKMGDKGQESMTFEQASLLKPSFGWAIVSAVLEFDKERAPKVPEVAEEAPKD